MTVLKTLYNILIVVSIIMNFGLAYTLHLANNDNMDRFDESLKYQFNKGMEAGIQYQTGFLEQSGVTMQYIANPQEGYSSDQYRVWLSMEHIYNNRYSAYARGMMDGSEYLTKNNEVMWYSAKQYNNKSQTIYIHDSVMDNDTKWKYYWAGYSVLLGRTHELDNKPVQSFVETTSNLQKSFYFLGRCQMKSVLNMESDKYNYYQNKTYDLLNASWDYNNDWNYNSGCK